MLTLEVLNATHAYSRETNTQLEHQKCLIELENKKRKRGKKIEMVIQCLIILYKDNFSN